MRRFLTSLAFVALMTPPVAAQAQWSPPRTPDGQPDLQGFWTNNSYTPLERPRDVTKEFYTEAEAAERERRAAQEETAQTEPGTIADVHYDFTQFGLDRSQSPRGLNLRTSMIVDPTDGRPHLAPEIRQWTGDSRGRWDGNTLVVETTNFNGKNPLRGSSQQMRVTERFTRVDADTIRDAFTVDDPSTWTRPWSAELPMRKTIGPLFEHACHEGNYGLYNTLLGARLEEKKAAEEAAKKETR